MNQESGHDLAGFSDRVSQVFIQCVSWVCNLIWGLTGEGYALVSRIQFLVALWLRASVSCCHQPGAVLISLEAALSFLSPGPPSMAAHNKAACFFKASQGVRDSSKMDARILCNVSCNYTQQSHVSCQLCHVLLFISKPQQRSKSHTRGENYKREWRSGGGAHGGLPRVYRPQRHIIEI